MVVEEARSFAVGTVRIRTFEDAFAEAQVVAESNFVGHNSTVAHSTLEANSDTHYGTWHVVLEFAFFVGVERYSGLPFLNLRRQIRVVRNFGSG